MQKMGRKISFTPIRESMPLTASIFPKLTTAHWHYLEISCTEFHRNGLQTVERKSRKSFAPFWRSMVLNEPIFTELTFARKIFWNKSHTEFRENLANNLVEDTTAQTDRQI
jgi:hypothetical protein